MGKQILKQPDGKFAIFSTISDGFCWTDCEEDEIVEIFAEEAAKSARENTRRYLEEINSGGRAYYQFTRSWDEARALHNKNYPREPIP